MSVTSQVPFKSFTAAPGATVFPSEFRVILATDLVVSVDGVVVTSGFTIAGLGATAGVDVTFTAPMVGGEVVELQREVPLVRATDYQQTGDFLAPVVNNDFDRLWMALQDQQFLSALAILLPLGDAASPMTIPSVAERANKFFAFDALGKAIAAVGAAGVPVTAFGASLVAAVSAAAARILLGVRADSLATSRLLGRTTAGTGVAEEISVGNGLNLAAGVLSSTADNGIAPVTASVAANALTISCGALTLDFRNAALGNGAVTTVSGTPANLVISSGSTLGTTNGVLSRLAVLALNNAGTIELAVVNLAGGVDISESGVISTTAEGGAGAADSATVVYSATARTNVPYRILRFIESTQATAGTWATAPSLVAGSAEPLALWLTGYGQTRQGITGSRAFATTYTNTTGREIKVNVSVAPSGISNTAIALVDGISAIDTSSSFSTGSVTFPSDLSFTVPAGSTYRVNITGTVTLRNWSEQR